jgi:diguanylate cyclase (GGDEF)-like protein
MIELPVHYSFGLIVVSVMTSMIAAYAAFSLADGMRNAPRTFERRIWLIGGSFAMGIGIWSMHYLGMLAVVLPVTVFYNVPIVLLSLGLAVAASSVVLSVVSAAKLGWRQLMGGGLAMGAGIGGMHYTGMAAMRMKAMHAYNPWIVGLSIAVAVGFSIAALWIGFSVRNRKKHGELFRIAGGVVMGLGIAAMHYTAMAGVSYAASPMMMGPQGWLIQMSALGRAAVAVTTLVVLAAALGTAAWDKRRNRQLEATQTELLEMQQQLREANALLSDLSIRDGLTGLFNRRHFDAVFDTEFRRAARTRSAVALLMLDVDRFKLYNDTYGHQQGDECLRQIAHVMEQEPRPRRGHDCVARYGGEEFVMVLPDANATDAQHIAESLREAVMALGLEHSENGGLVTVSVGVCSRAPEIGETCDAMLRDADTALYVAKELGRNRVVVAGEVPVVA